ncbi:hypothetical protein QT397_08565 [Microbulbifer sp. MKSA007]|nr:hypothetical protein QT397_08565 [Microbulbifer sp. MKSA007]
MSKEKLKHCCRQNQYEDAEIFYQKINRVAWGWVLSQWQSATEFDIEDGYEGEVGSQMCSHHLLIRYCPFCGEDLENKREVHGSL